MSQKWRCFEILCGVVQSLAILTTEKGGDPELPHSIYIFSLLRLLFWLNSCFSFWFLLLCMSLRFWVSMVSCLFNMLLVSVTHITCFASFYSLCTFSFLFCFLVKITGKWKKIVGWWYVKLGKIVVFSKLVVHQLCYLAWVKGLKDTSYETCASLS